MKTPFPLLLRIRAQVQALTRSVEQIRAVAALPDLSAEDAATTAELLQGTLQALELSRDVEQELSRELPTGPRLHVQFRPVASKKNGKERRYFTGPSGETLDYTGRSRRAKKDEASLAATARVAAYVQGWRCLQDEDVELRYVWTVGGDLDIEVRAIGPRPARGRTGRNRDLHGMLETVADALRGIAYLDDRQVARVVLERRLPSDSA